MPVQAGGLDMYIRKEQDGWIKAWLTNRIIFWQRSY